MERRHFLTTGLASGLTLATTRVEAQAIHTGTTGLRAGEVKIPVADGALPAYRACPEGPGPFPVVLVNEEIFGVHDYIKDVCRRLAGAGYLAVAPEIYARLVDFSKLTDFSRLMPDVVLKAPDATVLSDLDATLVWAVANGGDASRLGTIGFCRGGRNVWLYAAHTPRLKAAVAWYGQLAGARSAIQPRTALDVAGEIRCPLLALFGGQDASIPRADAEAAIARAKAAGAEAEMVVYPDAGHGFHADYRPSYTPAAATDGGQRTLAWLKGHGVG